MRARYLPSDALVCRPVINCGRVQAPERINSKKDWFSLCASTSRNRGKVHWPCDPRIANSGDNDERSVQRTRSKLKGEGRNR